jgi:general secretion pathway protein C
MRIRLPVARLVSVLLFAGLCGVIASWALKLFSPHAPIAPASAIGQAQPPTDLSPAGRLFGATPQTTTATATEAPSNVQVAGVLAGGPNAVALLAVDGKPAKPFGLGETIADGLKVTAINADSVTLDRRGQAVKLPMPTRSSLAVLNSAPPTPSPGMPAPNAPGIQTLPGTGAPMTPIPPAQADASNRPLPPAGAAAAPPEPQAPPPGMPGLGVPIPQGNAPLGSVIPPVMMNAPMPGQQSQP